MRQHSFLNSGSGGCAICGQTATHAYHSISANEIQIGGSHYKKNKIQTWDFIVQNGIGFLEGNAIKYLSRWKDKGGIEDLRKARHYIDKLIEVETERGNHES